MPTRQESIAPPQRAPQKSAIIRLQALLGALARMTFIARHGQDSTTRWAGRGRAHLSVHALADGWRIAEQGRFRPAGLNKSVGFSNVYRWQITDAGMRLGHERFGRDAAVALLTFVADGPDRLISQSPHLCGADRYHAAITLRAHGFDLAWHIAGPAKQECLDYSYRAVSG